MIDHATIEEQLAVYALGGMDADERTAFESEFVPHRTECERCARLDTEMRRTASLLALAEPPARPPAGLEDRILAAATGRGARAGIALPGRRWPLRRIAAVAAAAVLLVVGSVVGTLVATRTGDEPIRAVSLAVGEGQLALAYQPGSSEAVVIGQSLPEPPGRRVYQLWLRVDGRMVGSGTFRPEDGSVVARTELAAREFDLVAVTEEPPGGSEQPTSEPLAASPA